MTTQTSGPPTTEGPPPAAAPEVIEGPGRYIVRRGPDGGWVVGRATGICERCANCGCGEQAELIQIPGMVIQLAMSQGKGKILGMLKAATSRG